MDDPPVSATPPPMEPADPSRSSPSSRPTRLSLLLLFFTRLPQIVSLLLATLAGVAVTLTLGIA